MKFRVSFLVRTQVALDFGPNRSIRLAVYGMKVRHNELDCLSVYKYDRNFRVCHHYVLFINLVLAVPKMGRMSESDTFPECQMVLVMRVVFLFVFFAIPVKVFFF